MKTTKSHKIYLLFLLFITYISLFGCATRHTFHEINIPDAEMNAFLSNKPDELKPAYKRLLEEGRRNAVLNQMRIGLDAYQLGYKELAATAFNKTLHGIEAVYANNETAKQARSLWYEEGMKDYKGEPYERAMAYYYRGLLFLEKGDYENARAAFKSGILQDGIAEEQNWREDFALLIFLEGWASQMMGNTDMARTSFDEMRKLKPDFEMEPDANVLLLVESGTSPRKVADGPGHAELKFRRGRNFTENKVEASIDGNNFMGLFQIEDIFFQASTRGGRQIDSILEGQALFRQTHEKIGSAIGDISGNAMIASPLSYNSGDIQIASAAIGMLSVIEMGVAARTRAHADTRYWDNLPDKVYAYCINLSEGKHDLKVRFFDESGNEIPDLQKTVSFFVEKNNPAYIWLRGRQLISANYERGNK